MDIRPRYVSPMPAETTEKEFIQGKLDPIIELCDPAAVERLSAEISELHAEGIEISIGCSDDEAYEHPEKIIKVHEYLSQLDCQLDELRNSMRRDQAMGGIAAFSHNLKKRLSRRYRANRKRDMRAAEEHLREDLLFGAGEGKTNSMPWHEQRGRAVALTTIAVAHDLRTLGSEEGLYSGMSGPLDDRILDYTFEDGWLKGMPLEAAVAAAEERYGKKSPEVASRRARQRMTQLQDFVHAPTTEEFKQVIQYCIDSLGIRGRKEEVNRFISDHIDELIEKDQREIEDILIMSFGCGTALPILECMQQFKEKTGKAPRIILIDQDPVALAAAARLAEDMGLSDNIELHCERLFSRTGKPMDLDKVLQGRKLDVAEDSGLREYLPDRIYRALTKATWQSIRPGGVMSTGNMNKNRPQAEFLHGMMGWVPRVQMRAIRESLSLHEQAGVPRGSTEVEVTRDGVYSLFFSKK